MNPSSVANPGVVPFIDWNEAIFRADLSYKAKAVLHTIRYFMNAASGEAWPSCETIAKKTGCSKRTAINAIAEAVAAGFLVKKSRYDKSGHRTSNLYIRSVPISMAEAYAESDECGGVEVDGAPSELSDEKVALRLSARGAQELQEGFSSDEENLPSLKVPTESRPRSKAKRCFLADWQVPLFEKFWKAYWLKTGKPGAERRFAEVVDSEQTFAAIMQGVVDQFEMQMSRDTPKYAQGWLNERRWMDEIPPKWRKSMPRCGEAQSDRERLIAETKRLMEQQRREDAESYWANGGAGEGR